MRPSWLARRRDRRTASRSKLVAQPAIGALGESGLDRLARRKEVPVDASLIGCQPPCALRPAPAAYARQAPLPDKAEAPPHRASARPGASSAWYCLRPAPSTAPTALLISVAYAAAVERFIERYFDSSDASTDRACKKQALPNDGSDVRFDTMVQKPCQPPLTASRRGNRDDQRSRTHGTIP